MEPEDSLPYSQESATCPYPEPHKYSRCPPFHVLKIQFNITLPSRPGPYKWSLSLRFTHQNPIYTSPLLHTCYMTHPSHSSRFDHPNNIWWAVQIIKLLTMYFSSPNPPPVIPSFDLASTNHEAPQCAIFFPFSCYFLPFYAHLPDHAPCAAPLTWTVAHIPRIRLTQYRLWQRHDGIQGQ